MRSAGLSPKSALPKIVRGNALKEYSTLSWGSTVQLNVWEGLGGPTRKKPTQHRLVYSSARPSTQLLLFATAYAIWCQSAQPAVTPHHELDGFSRGIPPFLTAQQAEVWGPSQVLVRALQGAAECWLLLEHSRESSHSWPNYSIKE